MSNFIFLKSNYIPKKSIKNFPIEVVNYMIEQQVRQGNKADVTVFERDYRADRKNGGFDWMRTDEGFDWWDEVIDDKNFEVFFAKFPHAEKLYKK